MEQRLSEKCFKAHCTLTISITEGLQVNALYQLHVNCVVFILLFHRQTKQFNNMSH